MSERDWNDRESRDWNNKDSGAGWNTAADAKAIGTIDDYELLRELGTGGFGVSDRHRWTRVICKRHSALHKTVQGICYNTSYGKDRDIVLLV